MYSLLRGVVLLWWISSTESTTTTSSHGNTTSITSAGASSASITGFISTSGIAGLSSSSGNGTCPSRTVNYITHTLPRQCLRTDRVPQNSTSTATLTGSESQTTATIEATTSSVELDADQASLEVSDLPEEAETASATAVSATPSQNATASTATASTIPTESASGSAEEPEDSPLDNANFLSFEDWKKQNLAKTGQSLDDIGRAQPVNPNRPRPGINNALDTLGEESEIDLDFTGFGGAAKPSLPEGHQERTAYREDSSVGHHEGGSILRSKDAGKTCKERTNYASFDCSATILKSNKECKSASSVLVENKDSYMLNTCSAQNKFFIVQLCNDIQIDTIVLANYEFFSSSFRHFRVSVSDRYPVEMDKWKDLGTFEARNTRDIQAFLVENPIIWAKYLRIEFLSHYGTEYYCPVSLLRVHGTTMIEDYRHQEYIAQGEAEAEVTLEAEVLATPAVILETAETVVKAPMSSVPVVSDQDQSSAETEQSTAVQQEAVTPVVEPAKTHESTVTANASVIILDKSGSPLQVGGYETQSKNTSQQISKATTDETEPQPTSSSDASESSESTEGPDNTTASATSESTAGLIDSKGVIEPSSKPANSTDSIPATAPSAIASITNSTSASVVGAPINATIASATINQLTQTANSTRTAASPPPAQPSTQESFFKSFAKRLSMLESNSTLSLQYIEEQSRILRDAFSKVEKRQVSTTTNFLSQLNETVMAELHGFRQAYDQLWQSTVIELDGQRESYQREMLAMSSRLTMVADELVWQKRMGIVQSTLLLLCLALVLFGGRGTNGYLEMPLMQQFRRWEYSEPNSPSPDSRSPVSLFRRKLWRSKTEPAGESANITTDEEVSPPQTSDGPHVRIEPPSPPRHNESAYDDESGSNVEKSESEQVTVQDDVAPKRHRSRKKKKPPNWPQGNGGVDGVHGRAKSPLAM